MVDLAVIYSEVGIVDGLGYNINIPLLPGTQSLDWLHAL
ncbi:unnamed protein product, partial [marine sediment metagenome]